MDGAESPFHYKSSSRHSPTRHNFNNHPTSRIYNMKMNIASWFLWCIIALCSLLNVQAGGGGHGKHVVIKVPEIVHTHKHTHTIYKTIYHGHGGGGGHDFHTHGGKPFHWH